MCSEISISRHLQTALRCLPLHHLNALPCLSSALTTACGAETSRDRLSPPPPKRLPASGPQECCNLISQAVKAFIVPATSRFKSRSRVMHDSYVFTAFYLFKSHRRHSLQVHHQTSLPLRTKSLHTGEKTGKRRKISKIQGVVKQHFFLKVIRVWLSQEKSFLGKPRGRNYLKLHENRLEGRTVFQEYCDNRYNSAEETVNAVIPSCSKQTCGCRGCRGCWCTSGQRNLWSEPCRGC